MQFFFFLQYSLGTEILGPTANCVAGPDVPILSFLLGQASRIPWFWLINSIK